MMSSNIVTKRVSNNVCGNIPVPFRMQKLISKWLNNIKASYANMQIGVVNRLKIFDFDICFTIQYGQDKINTYFCNWFCKK